MAVMLFVELLEGAYSRRFTLKNLSYVKQLEHLSSMNCNDSFFSFFLSFKNYKLKTKRSLNKCRKTFFSFTKTSEPF